MAERAAKGSEFEHERDRWSQICTIEDRDGDADAHKVEAIICKKRSESKKERALNGILSLHLPSSRNWEGVCVSIRKKEKPRCPRKSGRSRQRLPKQWAVSGHQGHVGSNRLVGGNGNRKYQSQSQYNCNSIAIASAEERERETHKRQTHFFIVVHLLIVEVGF